MSALKEEERQVKKSKTPGELWSNLSGNKMCTQAGAPIRRFHQLERGATGGENEAWCPPLSSILAALGLISSPSLCLPGQVTPSLTPLRGAPAACRWAKPAPRKLPRKDYSMGTLGSLSPTLGVCTVSWQVRPGQLLLALSCRSQC